MKERIKEKAFPFTYCGWDEGCGDYGDIQFENVEFTADFGPIKAGSKFDFVHISHGQAILSASDKSGNVFDIPFKSVAS